MPFLSLLTGICHLAHVLTVPPTKARLLCTTPTGLDLDVQAMPYQVQSPGFPKIVYCLPTHAAGACTVTITNVRHWCIKCSYSFTKLGSSTIQAWPCTTLLILLCCKIWCYHICMPRGLLCCKIWCDHICMRRGLLCCKI